MKARCYTIWIKWKSWVPDRLPYSCVLHYETKPILVLYTRGSSVVLYISIHRSAVSCHTNVHPRVRGCVL